eukprot:3184539-Pleurochrysis_carterae.AAC.3
MTRASSARNYKQGWSWRNIVVSLTGSYIPSLSLATSAYLFTNGDEGAKVLQASRYVELGRLEAHLRWQRIAHGHSGQSPDRHACFKRYTANICLKRVHENAVELTSKPRSLFFVVLTPSCGAIRRSSSAKLRGHVLENAQAAQEHLVSKSSRESTYTLANAMCWAPATEQSAPCHWRRAGVAIDEQERPNPEAFPS